MVSVGSLLGQVIKGNILDFFPQTREALVELSDGSTHRIYMPTGWASSSGQFSGGFPGRGTTVYIVQGVGNEWIFVNYAKPDSVGPNVGGFDVDGLRLVDSSNQLTPGRWLTLVENDVSLIVDPKAGVIQGGSVHYTQADQGTGILSSRFLYQTEFTDAHRSITGPIKRDVQPNNVRNIAGSSLHGHFYLSKLKEIGLDPKPATSVSNASVRNPVLNESRVMFYEFADSFDYTNDEDEAKLYAGEDSSGTKSFQRKQSITDTMSLSLDHPNFLAEHIIGTVVDIYGNILDINRNILPSGKVDALSFRGSEEDKDLVFRKLREQLRRSIAYHFEINTRKENFVETEFNDRKEPGIFVPDYNDKTDYVRSRSRFFIDIDKEGQFKLNVPASSEVGNVPLLVRTENYSNIKGFEEKTDRGEFIRPSDSQRKDVRHEPHGKGVINLTSNEETLKAFSSPLNRFDGERIKLGTGFHDISGVLTAHKFPAMYSTDSGTGGFDDSILNQIDPVQDVVSTEVIVAGEGANAGGRSGTISMDGMLSLSVGANTIDRQSLWLDFAGGVVGAIGRDRFQRSVSLSLDGDLFMEVGGPTINDDSRFPTETFGNTTRDGVIDIRVWNSGSFHTIRIDNTGIKIHTPQRIDIVSEGTMRFKSVNSNIVFDAEGIFFYSGDESTGRWVQRATEGNAGRTI